jgi:hypothetical protein
MYTLEHLQQKSLKELKEIGGELNVLPEGDRRWRQTWIDAIAGVNPRLLELLEAQAEEPSIETVENAPGIAQAAESSASGIWLSTQIPYIPVPYFELYPAHRPIGQVPKNSPAASVDPAQEPIEPVAEDSPGVHRPPLRKLYPAYKLVRLPEGCLGYKGWIRTLSLAQLKKVAAERNIFLDSDSPQDWIETIFCSSDSGDYEPCLVDSEGFELGFLPPSVDDFLKSFTEAENSPGVEVDQAESPPECVECFDDGLIDQESGFIKFCHCSSGTKLSHQKTQRAIAQSANISLSPKSDQNPILTGISLSDRFLARYSPPQSETLHYNVIADGYKMDADGQLSLFEAQVVTEHEPPDPDDFESLDAFGDAIALWDREHPTSSSDHCSDLLPSSVQNELPLQVSLDSFCLWAHCPDDWYEPAVLLEPSPVRKSSITSDFFIPTFGSLGDRSNRSDEPPDTGIFARLPKPKPPKFPPQAASWTQVGRKLDTSQPRIPKLSRNYPETIPKLFHRVAASSSTQPARSPPGGDVMS